MPPSVAIECSSRQRSPIETERNARIEATSKRGVRSRQRWGRCRRRRTLPRARAKRHDDRVRAARSARIECAPIGCINQRLVKPRRARGPAIVVDAAVAHLAKYMTVCVSGALGIVHVKAVGRGAAGLGPPSPDVIAPTLGHCATPKSRCHSSIGRGAAATGTDGVRAVQA